MTTCAASRRRRRAGGRVGGARPARFVCPVAAVLLELLSVLTDCADPAADDAGQTSSAWIVGLA